MGWMTDTDLAIFIGFTAMILLIGAMVKAFVGTLLYYLELLLGLLYIFFLGEVFGNVPDTVFILLFFGMFPYNLLIFKLVHRIYCSVYARRRKEAGSSTKQESETSENEKAPETRKRVKVVINESSTRMFFDGKGYLRTSGDMFYDGKGYLRFPGDMFYDGKGYLRAPGDMFYDGKGYLRFPGDMFYDGEGYLR